MHSKDRDGAAAKLSSESTPPVAMAVSVAEDDFVRFLSSTRALDEHLATMRHAAELDDQIRGLEIQMEQITARRADRERTDLERAAKISRNNVERKRDFYHHLNPNRADKVVRLEREAEVSKQAMILLEGELESTKESVAEVRSKRGALPPRTELEERAATLREARDLVYSEASRLVQSTLDGDSPVFLLEAEHDAVAARLALEAEMLAGLEVVRRDLRLAMVSAATLDRVGALPDAGLGVSLTPSEREQARHILLLLACARADLCLGVFEEHFPGAGFVHTPLRRLQQSSAEEEPSSRELQLAYREGADTQLEVHFAPALRETTKAAKDLSVILTNEAAIAEARLSAALAFRQTMLLEAKVKGRIATSTDELSDLADLIRAENWRLFAIAAVRSLNVDAGSLALTYPSEDSIVVAFDEDCHQERLSQRTSRLTKASWLSKRMRHGDQRAALETLRLGRAAWMEHAVGLTPKVLADLAPPIVEPMTKEAPEPRRRSIRESIYTFFGVGGSAPADEAPGAAASVNGAEPPAPPHRQQTLHNHGPGTTL